MRGLIHILTMLAFAVHAVVGCCLHHHHESHSPIAGVEQNSKTLACHHQCPHHDDATSRDAHQNKESNKEAPCDESPCAFQAEPLIRMTEVLSSFQSDIVALALPAAIPASHADTKAFVEPRSAMSRHADAQTLRASLQIWLV